MLLDPAFQSRVDAVVVEFGAATHQDVMNAYVAGRLAEDEDLSRVWRDATGGALSGVWESPLYREFFMVARRANAAFRLLLGDPPRGSPAGRDAHFAAIVEEHVLQAGRRALLLAGGGHFTRVSDIHGGNVVQLLERSSPGCVRVVLPHFFFADVAERRPRETAAFERRLARWPAESMASIAGTWLADVDATLLTGDTEQFIRPDGTVVEVAVRFTDMDGNDVERVRLGEVADEYLYLGPTRSLTLAAPRTRDCGDD
jgi:hypothetical protein